MLNLLIPILIAMVLCITEIFTRFIQQKGLKGVVHLKHTHTKSKGLQRHNNVQVFLRNY